MKSNLSRGTVRASFLVCLTFAIVAAARATTNDYWAVEDRAARERLPLYTNIPAATKAELTPANGLPKKKIFLTWQRSHGDNGGRRYSALTQINRRNVAELAVAWTYHSHDSGTPLECNPIIVHDAMITPTPGENVVAVDAATGEELWRFKPEGRPAFRGLIYWPGRRGAAERIIFTSGPWLYALDPKTGKPVEEFGEHGKLALPGRDRPGYGASSACPTIFQEILIVPGYMKDVWGFDVVSGRLLWTFHTVPHEGEFGYDTWDTTEDYAANDWAGMALDDARGIAYISTAAPKPNFIGMRHRGQNLFANCVHRPRRPHRPAALAFPGNPPRYLGPRHFRRRPTSPPSRAKAGASMSSPPSPKWATPSCWTASRASPSFPSACAARPPATCPAK